MGYQKTGVQIIRMNYDNLYFPELLDDGPIDDTIASLKNELRVLVITREKETKRVRDLNIQIETIKHKIGYLDRIKKEYS